MPGQRALHVMACPCGQGFDVAGMCVGDAFHCTSCQRELVVCAELFASRADRIDAAHAILTCGGCQSLIDIAGLASGTMVGCRECGRVAVIPARHELAPPAGPWVQPALVDPTEADQLASSAAADPDLNSQLGILLDLMGASASPHAPRHADHAQLDWLLEVSGSASPTPQPAMSTATAVAGIQVGAGVHPPEHVSAVAWPEWMVADRSTSSMHRPRQPEAEANAWGFAGSVWVASEAPLPAHAQGVVVGDHSDLPARSNEHSSRDPLASSGAIQPLRSEVVDEPGLPPAPQRRSRTQALPGSVAQAGGTTARHVSQALAWRDRWIAWVIAGVVVTIVALQWNTGVQQRAERGAPPAAKLPRMRAGLRVQLVGVVHGDPGAVQHSRRLGLLLVVEGLPPLWIEGQSVALRPQLEMIAERQARPGGWTAVRATGTWRSMAQLVAPTELHPLVRASSGWLELEQLELLPRKSLANNTVPVSVIGTRGS